jgi:predicted transcriptional regulator
MTIHLTLKITDELNARLEELSEQTGNSKGKLLSKAIVLFELAVTEGQRGNHLSITNSKQQVIHEIVGIAAT